MKMLLHVCCGPCACGVLPHYESLGIRPLAFFYNPNIHPLLEHRRRLEGMREVAGLAGARLVVDAAYDPERWFEAVRGEEDSRCARCIGLRLRRAAREAVEQGCESFSTSLSISPWQDHEAIKETGDAAGKSHGVEFVYQDLRSLYSDSKRISLEHGIYRQKYCGCLVSEWERYREASGGCSEAGGGGGL